MNLERYSRQTILSGIGAQGQRQLHRARVLCIGVGGLGSPASLYLAAAGVGTIGLVDHDKVTISNLQRQILFQEADQGSSKVLVAKSRLQSLNPEITIHMYDTMFSAENADRIICEYDIVIDGSDNFETKFLINDAAYKLGIPMIYGSVNRFEGHAALFWGTHGACYRCLYPNVPKAIVQNCAEAGVLGSVVGTLGTLQATLALQNLLAKDDAAHPLWPAIGQLTIFDLAGKWRITTIDVPKKPDCPTCSKAQSKITYASANVGAMQTCSSIASITTQTLKNLLCETSSNVLIVDVRTHDEWIEGRIEGALHWPLDRLENGELPDFDLQTAIIVYCKSGIRSQRAANILTDRNYQRVQNLIGGIDSWNLLDNKP